MSDCCDRWEKENIKLRSTLAAEKEWSRHQQEVAEDAYSETLAMDVRRREAEAQIAALTEKLKATEEIIGLVCSKRFSASELFKAADKYRFAISKLSGAGEGG